MDLQLSGKTVLVTAGSAGIGLAIAKRFVIEGAHVTITGRDEAKLAAAAHQIAPHGRVATIIADAGTADGAAAIVQALADVDILINNLGVYPPRTFFEIADDEWMHIFQTNLLGAIRLCRAYFEKMLQRGTGRVVFVSSESAVLIPPSTMHYGLTKSAQLALSRGMAEMTKGTQVTVNCILPGPTWSDGARAFLRGLDLGDADTDEDREIQFFRHVKPTSIIQRFVHPDEVASMTAFIASPLASATNGAAVKVEGGVIPALV